MDLRLRRSCLRGAELGVVAVDNLLDGGAQEEVLQLHNAGEQRRARERRLRRQDGVRRQ